MSVMDFSWQPSQNNDFDIFQQLFWALDSYSYLQSSKFTWNFYYKLWSV